MKYLITIVYDGTNFYGFQRLNNKRSVQDELEKALTKINKKKVEIKGAGRTDRYVHAYGQCASFSLDVIIKPKNLIDAINSLLPDDLRVTKCITVPEDFHARFNALQKEYIYKINDGKYDPLKRNYYYHVNNKLDVKKLKKCAKIFIGIHDFSNFVSGTRENSEAIIYDIKIKRIDDTIEITFIGKSFYRYMVRNLVGAMLLFERDKITLDELKEVLDNKVERKLNCAPANGLYLMKIYY